MAYQFSCPSCGEDDDLFGRPIGETILLRCGRCGHEWPRDDTPRCATCGGTDLSTVSRAVVAGGRATVVSIVGRQDVPVCAVCDRDAVETYIARGHILPAGYITAASRPRS
jgi:uncharacterized Zn finger protein